MVKVRENTMEENNNLVQLQDENGNETYATPVQLAKAMNADLSVELAEATLYADDGAAEIVGLMAAPAEGTESIEFVGAN